MKLRILGLATVAIASSMVWASVAFAGGFEYPGDGTIGMGRGGANYAKADDPMALLYNPAALANTTGMQFLVSGHATLLSMCMDRFGSYSGTLGPTNEDISGVGMPKVCNGKKFSPIPSLAFSWRVNKKVGMGFGIFFPNSFKNVQYGNTDGTIDQRSAGGQKLPSPTRYALIDDNIIVAYPTFGVGLRPTNWFQFGAALTVGYAEVNFTNVVRALVPGESNSAALNLDALTKVRNATDWFVPRINVSMNFIPVDAVDIMVGMRYEDSIRAKGDISSVVKPNTIVATGATLKGNTTVTAPRPMWVSAGIRYADRINPRPDDPAEAKKLSGRIEDNMANERWDVELDAVYERNRVVDAIKVDSVIPRPPELAGIISADPLRPNVKLPHGYKDQLSLRMGGDWNVIPGTIALRAGISYETEGFKKGQGVIEFVPLERFGFHGGMTVRIFKKIDLSAAYAFFYHTPRTVQQGQGQLHQVVINPDGSASDGVVINEGKYTEHIHVISGGINFHIK